MSNSISSIKINKRLFFRIISLSSAIISVSVLSGCALVGSNNIAGNGVDYSISTAATNTVAGNENQAMPNVLSSSGNGSPTNNDVVIASSPVKYLPPANIGSLIRAQNNSPSSPVAPQYNIISNNLPALPKPTNSGSTTMPTQTMQTPIKTTVQPAVIANTPPVSQVAKPDANAYYHKIESGESLFSIARKYNVTVASIVSANGLASADKIGVGQKIAIPGRTDLLVAKPQIKTTTPAAAPVVKKPQVAPVKPAPQQVAVAKPAPQQVAKPVAAASSDKFLWPVSGKIITDFAGSKGTGINISAPEGSPIKSAQSGTVIYVGNAIEGYGNLILIKHDNGFVSAYAHLSKTSIAKGDVVSRGQIIGLAGQTGSVTSSQLHFEIRKGATPVDPVPMLAS